MTEPMLANATVQEIQLELIRRSRFNNFDGERVVASLEQNRELWTAVCMDRLGLASAAHPDRLPAMSLIKLRDLGRNTWNVDTLFVLTESLEKTQKLAQVAVEGSWQADEVIVQDNAEEMAEALGYRPYTGGMLTVWWD
ncbi:hypothetical protein [Nocardia altamirensis]|uniref:hypothetical protein n=1 Tax=Nocardia altamirensis TaxID=472158 RepID=UPI00084058C9|nr:hypothetical protein [Nocardia altamirensis]